MQTFIYKLPHVVLINNHKSDHIFCPKEKYMRPTCDQEYFSICRDMGFLLEKRRKGEREKSYDSY